MWEHGEGLTPELIEGLFQKAEWRRIWSRHYSGKRTKEKFND
jgi:hypothetical protein